MRQAGTRTESRQFSINADEQKGVTEANTCAENRTQPHNIYERHMK